ncbi:hypothetical protein [Pyrobaculum sp.]|uniref:hypothetical protein n=1 Tax=Pyrobaculum sp. TaxID=2004705 RepID=UPI003D11D31B
MVTYRQLIEALSKNAAVKSTTNHPDFETDALYGYLSLSELCVPTGHVFVQDGGQVKGQVKVYYRDMLIKRVGVDDTVDELMLSAVLGFRSVVFYTPKMTVVALCKKLKRRDYD